MTASERELWRARQRRMNLFTSKYLKGVGKLREDGVMGPATVRRIKQCKWWLGYDHAKITGKWTNQFHNSLLHPLRPKYSSRGTVRRGIYRRKRHNANWVTNHVKPGIEKFDGVWVASWMVPYLTWARQHGGWHGWLVSGFRDPVYSEHLCYAMCGAPRCPGRCAGRSSNHSGKVKPAGAVDVAHYDEFRRAMQNCPYRPLLVNRLGAQDPVHFSVSGV